MTKQQIIELILENGDASQKYIVKRDILGVDKKLPEMKELQEQVINSKAVQKILKAQNEEGWIGMELHGCPGKAMDSSISCLIDLGIEPQQPFMKRAKQALLRDANPDPRKNIVHGIGIRGYDFSRSTILGDLYIDGEEPEQELISAHKRIIEILKIGIKTKSLDEVSRLCTRKKYIGYRAYLKDKIFPWPSDMNVLSCCTIWETKETRDIVNSSLKKIAEFMPIPTIFEVINGYYLAPICNYGTFSYEDCTQIPKGEIVFWLRDFNRLCRISDISEIPYFYKQALKLKEHIENDDFIDNLSEQALKAIENTYGYSGRWKSDIQRKVDIYFRVLLILHNAKAEF